MDWQRQAVKDRIISRHVSILAWASAVAKTIPTEADAKTLCEWIEQRFAACASSGKLDAAQFMREVLQRGLDILDGKDGE